MKNRRAIFLFTGLLVSIFSARVVADETVDELIRDMIHIEQNEQAHQAAIVQGEERGILCFSCHGRDGNSKRDYIPNLASQNAAYLFTQFEHFANGIRKDYVMSKLAKQLTDKERVAIALYFADKEVKPRQQPVAPSDQGKQLYDSMCFACHGQSAHGSREYPRIAGQPYEYLETTLLNFLSKNPERAQSPMVAVVQNLTEQQLKDVASYVAHMP
ncbi:c-type cytochrome [Oceanobacter kriegii]|uniref:c-type cytochrome n=1 Tax=Oceanobacter kriegii TaxID=64972 RepID=UPI00040378DD|nr:c-type cytochrome [Oceanobacter kriegii]